MPAATHAGVSGQEVTEREINTETVPTPVFLTLIIHYPAHSHPPFLCSSPWELLMSQNEGWSGSTGKLGERREEGKVGGSREKVRMKTKRKRKKRAKMKNKEAVLSSQDPHIHQHLMTRAQEVQKQLQIDDYYSVCSIYIDSVLTCTYFNTLNECAHTQEQKYCWTTQSDHFLRRPENQAGLQTRNTEQPIKQTATNWGLHITPKSVYW